MMDTKESIKNIMVVYAVENFAMRHKLTEDKVLDLFFQYRITELIRNNYEALHTQDFEDCVDFAEDILRRNGVKV
jgi:hypothetical protein